MPSLNPDSRFSVCVGPDGGGGGGGVGIGVGIGVIFSGSPSVKEARVMFRVLMCGGAEDPPELLMLPESLRGEGCASGADEEDRAKNLRRQDDLPPPLPPLLLPPRLLIYGNLKLNVFALAETCLQNL